MSKLSLLVPTEYMRASDGECDGECGDDAVNTEVARQLDTRHSKTIEYCASLGDLSSYTHSECPFPTFHPIFPQHSNAAVNCVNSVF